MSRWLRSRWIAVTVVLAAMLGIGAGATAVVATQAAWTDNVYSSVPVSGGTWASGNSCVAKNPSGNTPPSATCKVTTVTYNQWSDGTNTVRDYYVGIQLSNNASYGTVVVDLANATGNGGAWTWGSAVTLATGQYTLAPGYLCSELPTLRANGPSNWGTSYSFWVRVVQAPTGLGANKNCA